MSKNHSHVHFSVYIIPYKAGVVNITPYTRYERKKDPAVISRMDRILFAVPQRERQYIGNRLCVLLNVKNLLAVVVTANLANAMRTDDLIALRVRTLGKTVCHQLGVVRSSGISATLGYFTLWYCHFATSS